MAVERYLDRVTATRFADDATTPLRRIPQAIAPDGQMWIQHSIGMVEHSKWRLRSSEIDNAPAGRPIYWSSGWAIWLSVCGWLRMLFTQESRTVAIESASLWANLPVFLALLVFASNWVRVRWGGWAGGFAAIALIGHRKFYEGFYPAYCDHHGLVSMAILGLVLGALFAGVGWWKKEVQGGFVFFPKSQDEVMRAATISAACGSFGMWISAASLVAVIAFIGIAVVVTGLCMKRGEGAEGLRCVPRAWQRWGQVGALMSFGFYLLENFPDRIGLRLEANHPLYSLAWWGAGEAIAAVLVWKTETRSSRWLALRLSWWGAAVAIAPLVMYVKGSEVFTLLDPFLTRIHSGIHEFESLWAAMTRMGWKAYMDQVLISLCVLVLLVVWMARKPPITERLMIGFAAIVALASTALGWYQSRWLLTASASQIGLTLVLLIAITAKLSSAWRVLVIVVTAFIMYMPGPFMIARERRLVERVHDVQIGETVQLLYRDIAAALLTLGANPDSVVLSNPNASVGIGYYGQLRTVGTLYWENQDGLRAAAEIFGAREDAEAEARIRGGEITHVVMISSYDFLEEYDFALRNRKDSTGGRDGFGYRLLYEYRVPVWLRPLDYQVPAPLAPLGFKVAIFAVNFDVPLSIAHERIGLYQLGHGALDLAEGSFMAAMTEDPSRPAPWLLEGELMLSTGRVSEAFNFVRAGIERSPVSERAQLLRSAAKLFAEQGKEGQRKARALLELVEP